MIHVEVQYDSELSPLPTKKQLREWARMALAEVKEESEITLRIVDETESHALNFQFRGKDKPTNVLSFPYEVIPEMTPHLLGDLVLCAPVILREANEQEKEINAHWAHMIIHGCLHLLGYDHVTPEQAAVMEPLEVTLLNRIGFANPY
jgi:probable rRNA maturation factor